jgi:hypothetical protein
MASQDALPLTGHTPKESPLAPLPTKHPLTPGQWKTILALADTVVPCVRPERSARKGLDISLAQNDYAMALNKIERFTASSGNANLAREYLSERPSENQAFKDNLYRLLALYVPADLKQQLTLGLTLLE